MKHLVAPATAAEVAPAGGSTSTAFLPAHPDNLPPVIVLGGRANALSVARQIGRLGAAVYALNVPGAFVGRSRFCLQIVSAVEAAVTE